MGCLYFSWSVTTCKFCGSPITDSTSEKNALYSFGNSFENPHETIEGEDRHSLVLCTKQQSVLLLLCTNFGESKEYGFVTFRCIRSWYGILHRNTIDLSGNTCFRSARYMRASCWRWSFFLFDSRQAFINMYIRPPCILRCIGSCFGLQCDAENATVQNKVPFCEAWGT